MMSKHGLQDLTKKSLLQTVINGRVVQEPRQHMSVMIRKSKVNDEMSREANYIIQNVLFNILEIQFHLFLA